MLNVRFGTSGIRGLTDVEITPQACFSVSAALARFLGKGSRLAIGHDTRPGAKKYAGICASAMASEGASVINLGVAPSPVICAYIYKERLDGGLVVTGSHLPYDRLGLIPLGCDGTIPPPERTRQIEAIAKKIDAPIKKITGDYGSLASNAVTLYLQFAREVLGENGPGKGISVALDPAGGAGAGVISWLMNSLGCKVKSIDDVRTDVAPRQMEPRKDTVTKLSKLVTASNSDFGAAYDADCDRVLFLDEKGQTLSEDLAGAIFAKYIYNSGPGNCVTPINSSSLIKKVWKGQVVECRVGPPEISLAIKQHVGRFAYEESGKYFFPPKILWADGIMATIMMAGIISKNKKSLSEIASEFPRHFQVKKNLRGEPADMQTILEKVRSSFRPEAALNDMDGLKYVYPDGSWLLFRPSGTEPLLRVYVDSASEKTAKALSAAGVKFVKELLGGRISEVKI